MQTITSLKTLYKVQMILGSFITLFVTGMVAVMGTDSPSSTAADAILGAFIGFSLSFSLMVLIPLLANRELNNYPAAQKLLFNYLESLVLIFMLFPVALWQIYVLYTLKKSNGNSVSTYTKVKVSQNKNDSSSHSALAIVAMIILFFAAMHYLGKYLSKERDILVVCDREEIVTKGPFSNRVYFQDHIWRVLGKDFNTVDVSFGYIEDNTIVVTQPYWDEENIQEIKKCLRYTNKYTLRIDNNRTKRD